MELRYEYFATLVALLDQHVKLVLDLQRQIGILQQQVDDLQRVYAGGKEKP